MSVRSLTTLAVERDRADPASPVAGGGGRTAANAPDGTVPQGFTDVLISAIPTEPLAACTALVGVAVGAVNATDPRAYLSFRWWCFAGFVVLTILAVYASYLRDLKAPSTGAPPPPKETHRRFPLAEIIAASIAAAAWGLVMPGSPLNVQMSGTSQRWPSPLSLSPRPRS